MSDERARRSVATALATVLRDGVRFDNYTEQELADALQLASNQLAATEDVEQVVEMLRDASGE